MKIYTQVLIGMAVGALVGIFLGPKSEFLEHDTYIIADASSQSFFMNKDDESTQVLFPAGLEIELRSLKLERGVRADAKGEQVEVPVWAQVSLRWKKEFFPQRRRGEAQCCTWKSKEGRARQVLARAQECRTSLRRLFDDAGTCERIW